SFMDSTKLISCTSVTKNTGIDFNVGLNGVTSFSINFTTASDDDTVMYHLFSGGISKQSGTLIGQSGMTITNTSGYTIRTLQIEYRSNKEGDEGSFSISSLTVNWTC
ncbi:MAG: hypothetical protein K6B65_02095, partial [Bacilli bacterium]|nr:hypothetical protein [Bacilli bacterium]